jgi:hypothetical protein
MVGGKIFQSLGRIAPREGEDVSRKEPRHAAPPGALRNSEEIVRSMRAQQFPFIIFVDRIFTNLFERPFTKVFDAPAQTSANSCVYRACHAD